MNNIYIHQIYRPGPSNTHSKVTLYLFNPSGR